MAPRPVPVVDIGHLHAPVVSVREQAAILAERLRASGSATFRTLIADCPDRMMIVGRFLAVLELYREGSVAFDQVSPLGELHIRWVAAAGASGEINADVDAEYDAIDDESASDQPASGDPVPALVER